MKRIVHFFRNFALHFDRSFSKSQIKQVWWLTGFTAVVFLLLLALSFVPGIYEAGQEEHGRVLDIMFLLFDPGNFTDGMSGGFILVVALVGIVLFIGCLISVISNILNNRVELVRGGETYYKLRDHTIIIGYNDAIPSLIHSIYLKDEQVRRGEAFILLMSEQPAEDIRAKIHVANTEEEEDCVLVLRGQRTAIDELEKLSLPRARAIYIIGEPNEEAHDSLNMECLMSIASLMPERTIGLPDCNVQFDQPTLFSIFQFSNIPNEIIRRVNFIPYNFCDIWAQKVMVKCEAEDGLNVTDYRIRYLPIDGAEGIRRDSERHVHVVITGMSQMGVAMAVQTAHIAHFPNFDEATGANKTVITLIDPDAKREMHKMMTRFRAMFQLASWQCFEASKPRSLEVVEESEGQPWLDIAWQFIEAEPDAPEIQQFYLDAVADEKAITTLIFAHDDQDEALRSALYLPYPVYDLAHQILVYQDKSPAIAHNLSGFHLPEVERPALRFHKLKPFGMNTEFHIGDLDSEKFGRLVNVAYSHNPDDGMAALEQKLSDAALVEKEWNAISMANKWSSIYCANMRYVKLRFIGCDLDTSSRTEIETAMATNIDIIKRTEHNRWNVEKLLMGFRPLTAEEQKADKAEKKRLRKSSQLAHLDICSYSELQDTDPGTIVYDESVNLALPVMVDIIRKEKTMDSTLPKKANTATKLLLSLALLCLAAPMVAQSVQTGVVMEYRGEAKKTPMAGVAITAANAASTVSDAQGQFTLNFRTLKAGDAIQFRRIEKTGYEVMNREAVEVARVARATSIPRSLDSSTPRPTDSPLSIILCRTTLLNQIRDGYRSVMVKRYEKQLAEQEAAMLRLKEEGCLKEEEYNARLDSLEAAHEAQLADIETYIDRFARIDMTALTEAENRTIKLVQEGRFEEAIANYESQDLVTLLNKARAERQQLTDLVDKLDSSIQSKEAENRKLRESINRQIDLLHLAGGQENMEKIHHILREVFLADTTDVMARREYAQSLYARGEKEQSCKVLICGVEHIDDDFGKTMQLLDLALYSDDEQKPPYLDALNELAAKIEDSNPKINSRVIPSASAIQLYLYLNRSDMERCASIVENVRKRWSPDSLDIRSVINYTSLVSIMADYYSTVGNHELTLWAAEEVVRLDETIDKTAPWRSRLYMSYATACDAFAIEGQWDKAVDYAHRFLHSGRNLYKILPTQKLMQGLCDKSFTVYWTLADIGERQLADSVAQFVEPVYDKLHASQREPLKGARGLYLLAKGDIADATPLLNEDMGEDAAAITIAPFLAKELLNEGKVEEAINTMLSAIEGAKAQYTAEPDAWNKDTYCCHCITLAEIYTQTGDKKSAKRWLRQAEKLVAFESNRIKINRAKQ